MTFFGDFGGRKLNEVVRRILPHLLSSDLAVQFNMVGSKGKEAFGSSKLFEVIFRTYYYYVVFKNNNNINYLRMSLKCANV